METTTESQVRLSAKDLLKAVCNGFALLCVVVPAALTGFGRWAQPFKFFAQTMALIPGLPGDYLRVAFYFLTLDECPLYSRISFGSFFAQSSSIVGHGVYVGCYCVIGSCRIGANTQIASDVQVFAGGHQHERAADGSILGADESKFSQVSVGANCWIGAGAIVMADIGDGTTIGAGSVVPRSIPAHSVAVGNPARVLVKEMV